MAAGPFRFYANGFKNYLNGNADFLTATMKAALVLSTYTPDASADDAWNDVSAYECADGDYAAQTLGTKTISVNGDGLCVLDAANVDYGASVTITAKFMVVYKDSGVASTSYLLGYIDLDESGGGSASSAAAPFQVNFASEGMAALVP